MNRSVLMAAVLVLTPLAVWGQVPPLSEDRDPSYSAKGGGLDARGEKPNTPSASHLRDGVATALETVERACATDIDDYCPRVTAGEGRMALCMRAHEDQLSRGCQLALHRVSRGLEGMVKRIAEACWTEVRELCGDADKVGQCVAEKDEFPFADMPEHRRSLGTASERIDGSCGHARLQLRQQEAGPSGGSR